MGTRASARFTRPVVYNEKVGGDASGGGPAWARQLHADKEERLQKENSKPIGKERKSAPAAVAVKGRDAGLTRLPIEDVKPGSKSAGSKKHTTKELLPAAAAGKQVLPGVMVKMPGAAAAAAKDTRGSKGSADKVVQGKPAPKSGRGEATATNKSSPDEAAKPAGKAGSGGKRKLPPHGEQGVHHLKPKPAATATHAAAVERLAAADGPAVKPAAKRQKPGALPQSPVGETAATMPQRQQQQQEQAGIQQVQQQRQQQAVPPAAADHAQQPAAPLLAALEAGQEVQLPSSTEALIEQYAANFRDLQAEYAKLQALYEDLKAAKIHEEVAELLEQQNTYVSEHGQQAAQLAEHYKSEAERQAALVMELQGGALTEQCRQLSSELATCRQALLDKEAQSLEQSREVEEMKARLAFLERFARTYETSDRCIQTDPAPHASAGCQYPSLQSSGVEMMQAHALVPEGAGAGSIYHQPKLTLQQGPSSTVAAPALLPPGKVGAGQASPPHVMGAEPATAMEAGAAVAVSGSDMQLTGTDETQPAAAAALPRDHAERLGAAGAPAAQQQQAERQQHRQAVPGEPQAQLPSRRHSLQPMSGRLAHAAAGGARGRPANGPSSAESQAQLAGPAAPQQQHPVQRPVAAGAPHRRLSEPPPPIDRQLHFSGSLSVNGGCNVAVADAPAALPAVPEEQQLWEEQHAEVDLAGQESNGGEQEERQHQQQGQLLSPAQQASASRAAAALAAAGAPTPGSVPAPPRDLAITALTGLVSTPLRGGFYQFSDGQHGYVFQLGPHRAHDPDSAPLPAVNEDDHELVYRPIALGTAASLLPSWFHDEFTFRESQRWSFVRQLLDALR